MCVQIYIFSVLGLTRMGIDPISYHLTASLCHLMDVFMFGKLSDCLDGKSYSLRLQNVP